MQDLVNAGMSASTAPVTGDDALDMAARTADHTAKSPVAQGAVRSLAASPGTRNSMRAAGKMLATAGDLGGKVSLVFSSVKAGMGFACVGW